MLSLASNHSDRSLPDFLHHQETLRALRAESEAIQVGSQKTDTHLGILSCQFLLSMFALSEYNEWRAHHNRAMIDVINTTTLTELCQSELGRFLVGISAMSDISALAIGSNQASQRCWIDWVMSTAQSLELTNSSLESIIGYPPSLIDVFAQVAANSDRNCNEGIIMGGELYQVTPQYDIPINSDIIALETPGGHTVLELEHMIQSWMAPPSRLDAKPYTELIRRIAWECIRKAAFIFLWRGKGFQSNLLESFPAERKHLRDLYVNEIISNLQAIFEMVQMRQLSIGNLTLWSLAVVGSECGRHSGIHRSEDVAALLRSLGNDFAVSHALRLEEVFRLLWAREKEAVSYGATPSSAGQQVQQYLSLEHVAREKGLEIMLL